MNDIRRLVMVGVSAVTLLAAPAYTMLPQPVMPDAQVAQHVLQFCLAMEQPNGQRLAIKEISDNKNGFDASRFTIFFNTKANTIPYCGYDEKSKTVVKKYVTADQILYDGIKEVIDYMAAQTNDNIFAHLYGQNADVHKLLWENPYGRPEAKFTAITGLVYKDGKLTIDPMNSMAYAFNKAKTQGETNFVPRIFSVTYDRFTQIQRQYPNVNLLEGIEKLLSYKHLTK